jgi:hypothetical protein
MTDVSEYLTKLSKQLIIDPKVKEKIEVSISHIQKEIWGLFQDKLSTVSVFGSYDRLSIIMEDEEADVDIMIVFKKNEFQPETYLKQIRRFCEEKYPRSTVYPDHPTVAVELDHIKFELIPAIYYTEGAVKIPAPRTKELKWIPTSPKEFKKKVDSKDKNNKELILPVIRILKYWNILEGKLFSSYELEKNIIEKLYDCRTLGDYYFSATYVIGNLLQTDRQKTIFANLKEHNRVLKVLEREKLFKYLEPEFSEFLSLLK